MALERLVRRRAKKIAAETGRPSIVVVIDPGATFSMVHRDIQGATMGQVEHACLALLEALIPEVMDAAVDCDACAQRFQRISAARAALAPGFGEGQPKGSC